MLIWTEEQKREVAECFLDGVRAPRKGLSPQECPWRRGTLEYEAWQAGYTEGER